MIPSLIQGKFIYVTALLQIKWGKKIIKIRNAKEMVKVTHKRALSNISAFCAKLFFIYQFVTICVTLVNMKHRHPFLFRLFFFLKYYFL